MASAPFWAYILSPPLTFSSKTVRETVESGGVKTVTVEPSDDQVGWIVYGLTVGSARDQMGNVVCTDKAFFYVDGYGVSRCFIPMVESRFGFNPMVVYVLKGKPLVLEFYNGYTSSVVFDVTVWMVEASSKEEYDSALYVLSDVRRVLVGNK